MNQNKPMTSESMNSNIPSEVNISDIPKSLVTENISTNTSNILINESTNKPDTVQKNLSSKDTFASISAMSILSELDRDYQSLRQRLLQAIQLLEQSQQQQQQVSPLMIHNTSESNSIHYNIDSQTQSTTNIPNNDFMNTGIDIVHEVAETSVNINESYATTSLNGNIGVSGDSKLDLKKYWPPNSKESIKS
jgi:hypothetical protein